MIQVWKFDYCFEVVEVEVFGANLSHFNIQEGKKLFGQNQTKTAIVKEKQSTSFEKHSSCNTIGTKFYWDCIYIV